MAANMVFRLSMLLTVQLFETMSRSLIMQWRRSQAAARSWIAVILIGNNTVDKAFMVWDEIVSENDSLLCKHLQSRVIDNDLYAVPTFNQTAEDSK